MSLDKPFGEIPVQNELIPRDIGNRFSAIVKEMKEKVVKSGSTNLVLTLEITATSSPKKYVGKVFDNYHGWGQRMVAGSQYNLAVYRLQLAGFKTAIEALGREVIMEKIPVTESPNYQPSANPDFVGEKYPRYYIVETV